MQLISLDIYSPKTIHNSQNATSPSLPSSPPCPSSLLPDSFACDNLKNITELNNKHGLRIVSWNICSLIPKLEEVKQFVDQTSPDILCLQEIWQIPSNINISLTGYHDPFVKQRKNNKKGGGVITYIKSHLSN